VIQARGNRRFTSVFGKLSLRMSIATAALLLSLIFAARAGGAAPHPSWGRLANPGFEGRRIRTTLFFSGQAKDGTNPYGCPSAPPANMFLYTVSPSDARHLRWSDARANREFALKSMIEAGINVVSMSTWGEAFLSCDESWALWAPMQTSPASHDDLFAAAGTSILTMPFIESRANWTFYNEFPRWTDGSLPEPSARSSNSSFGISRMRVIRSGPIGGPGSTTQRGVRDMRSC